MATPEISVPLLLQAVRRRPEVWTTTPGQTISDKKRAAIWKQICQHTWPEFDSWTVEQKRTRCLILQKKWKTMQQDFMNAHKQGNSAQKSAHHDLLTFLVADKKQSCAKEDGPRASKRARTEAEEECTEDRHFLLSLESYMRDVPRSSKLALREDMLRLLRKYTPADDDDLPSDTTHSQEY